MPAFLQIGFFCRKKKLKYRRLTSEELESLEKEFVTFLASRHITAEIWEEIRSHDPGQVDKILDAFSDAVMEATMQSVRFLEYMDGRRMWTFQCRRSEIMLVGLEVVAGADDLESREDWLAVLESNPRELRFISQTKPYTGDRQLEIFKLLNQQGCRISDGELFRILSLAMARNRDNA